MNEMNVNERTQTGIDGLDENLEGGFPRGSMIMIAGNPGTGKTMLCGEFLHHGTAKRAENGLYVSLSEGRRTFLTNMRRVGRDLEAQERAGRLEIMDLITSKEAGVDAIMETITTRLDEVQARRLVIDSFTAMAHAFPTLADERVVLHLLSKIVRNYDCTTLLVTEVPTGQEAIGTGVEEFIVDGIIVVRRSLVDGTVMREMEVTKMRGTKIGEPRQLFSLHGGFNVFRPFKEAKAETPRPFRKIPGGPDRFSTGNPQLDALLGGFGRGDTVFIEVGEDVPWSAPHHIIYPLCANFIAHDMGVLILPPCGESAERIVTSMGAYGTGKDRTERLLRIADVRNDSPEGPHVFHLDADDIRLSQRIWDEEKERLRESTGGQVLEVVNTDKACVHWPMDQVRRAMETESKRVKVRGDLLVLLSNQWDRGLSGDASKMAGIHLRLRDELGVALLQGIRPRTPLHALEATAAGGYPSVALTPLN